MTAATYNGNGLRANVTTGSGTQDFVWTTADDVPQIIMDSGNAYIYVTGQARAEQVNLSTGAITYLVSDLIGSIRGTVNSSGSVTGTTSYDAWGNPETSGGLTATTPFGYAGGYTDPTGLIDLINRYYDPTTGQFISVDPIDSLTAKPYAYADGNPINNNDPLGLATYFRCYDYSYTWGGTGKKTWGYRYAGCTWALGEYGTHLLVDLMNWIGTLLSLCAGLSLIADVLDVGATTPLTIACTVGGALSF